jgi:hypothetical protein
MSDTKDIDLTEDGKFCSECNAPFGAVCDDEDCPGKEREHILSKDCWCQPTVETPVSYTPRTDRFEKIFPVTSSYPLVSSDFARQLEGELAAMTAERDGAVKLLASWDQQDKIDALQKECAELRKLISYVEDAIEFHKDANDCVDEDSECVWCYEAKVILAGLEKKP